MFKEFKNINDFFAFGVSLVINYYTGLIICVVLILVGSTFLDYRKNVKRIDSLNIVDVGTLHKFSANRGMNKCIVFNGKKNTYWEAAQLSWATFDSNCQDVLAKSKNWKKYAKTVDTKWSDVIFISVIIMVVGIAVSGVVGVALILIGSIKDIEWMENNYGIFSGLILLGFIAFNVWFCVVNFSPDASTLWFVDGGKVEVEYVVLADDGKFYVRPNKPLDWIDNDTGRKVGELRNPYKK